MKNLIKGILGLTIITAAVITAGYAMNDVGQDDSQLVKADTVAIEQVVYNEALGDDLINALNQLDISLHDITMDGLITVYNPSDSSENVNQMPYQVIKTSACYYYKVGDTETLNGKEGYVYIDHDAQTIILEAAKAFNLGVAIPNAKALIKVIKKEKFKLWSTEDDRRKTIIIENTYNLNQHKFAITIDKATGKPINIYTKIPNLEDPFNTGSDKVVNYTINIKDKEVVKPVILNCYQKDLTTSLVKQFPTYAMISGE